jgi:hypothetical protein
MGPHPLLRSPATHADGMPAVGTPMARTQEASGRSRSRLQLLHWSAIDLVRWLLEDALAGEGAPPGPPPPQGPLLPLPTDTLRTEVADPESPSSRTLSAGSKSRVR